ALSRPTPTAPINTNIRLNAATCTGFIWSSFPKGRTDRRSRPAQGGTGQWLGAAAYTGARPSRPYLSDGPDFLSSTRSLILSVISPAFFFAAAASSLIFCLSTGRVTLISLLSEELCPEGMPNQPR